MWKEEQTFSILLHQVKADLIGGIHLSIHSTPDLLDKDADHFFMH